jgi:hypothetical protein
MKLCFCKKVDGTGDHNVKQKKSDSERQIQDIFSYVESRPKEIKHMNIKAKLFGWGISGS